MKRILAILCVIACLCGLCVPAMAAGTVTVHAYVLGDWNSPNCYTWLSSSNNPNWPGDAMTSEGDGWWSFDIPANQDRVIINNGSGSPQTVDIAIEPGKEVWIKVLTNTNAEGKHEYEIGYSKDSIAPPAAVPSTPAPSTGVDLSGLNSLALVGGGIPGLPEWAPGEAACNMTKVSNGVYTKVISVTAGAAMEIKAAGNGSWNDAYNFGPAENGTAIVLGTKMEMVNGGGAQNFALTIDKDCNLKFTVDLTGDVPTMLVEETDEEPTDTPPTQGGEVTGETYTVYAKIPADWKTPAIWCWNDSDQNPSNIGTWPGTYYMTKGENGWWTFEVPVGYNNVLVNANGGGVQTADVKGLSGADVWINAYTDPQNPVFAYEEITDIVEPTTKPPVEATIRPTGGLNEGDDTQTESKGGKDLTVLLSIIGSVVIIAIAAVIVIIAKSKKKAA